ncbi:MAG: hypothetical protein HKN23_20430 [Verrucomicrobiales bacterium]|nr:hypothetical protein [Verrucomicrobiales bacterium]
MPLKILRISLIFVSLTGFFAIAVLLMPWKSAIEAYKLFGIDMPPTFEHPYMEYLTYLGAALSVFVGALYFMAGAWPKKYANLIVFLGWGLLFIGVVVLYHGLRLKLPPWPFYPDPIISFVFGVLILVCYRKVKDQLV